MPKEQAHFGERPERVPQGTSKNAKDKSNSATLRASQCGTHRDQEGRRIGMNGRMSRSDSEKDSEKDSGYSETGSDSVQNDLDDQRSSVSEAYRAHSSSSSLGHNMPLFEEQNPIYVIKNLVVKPFGPEQLLHRTLAWGGGWDSLSGSKAPTQLLLIQKPGVPSPVPAPNNLPDPQGQSKKGGSRSNKNHNSKNSYLPILNSYPRIAPHPRKEGSEQSREGAGDVKERSIEGQSRSKRVCTEDKREAATHLRPQQHQHHQQESRTQSHYKVSSSRSSSSHLPHHSMGGPASFTQQGSHYCHQHAKPSPSPSHSNSFGSPSVISSQTSSSSSSSADSWAPQASVDLSDCLSDCSLVRQRRFFNTAEILSQSGLLAITLRTKELLRQNAATEKELAQLRQHAQLLCLAAQTGQETTQQGPKEDPSPMDKLFQAMSQSRRYPSLDWTYFNANSNNHPEKGDEAEKDSRDSNNNDKHSPSQNPVAAAPLSNHDDVTSPPSPIFALSPDPEDCPDVLASLLSISPISPFPRAGPETWGQR
ncbi:CLOCK-interacting pacemaker-like [Salvelinus fontinalis]|uniref:CLOCK-interacting pacemaker-like n=1 Tax=Salvelinus fontinalis TaxID=8038 RepID=UPI0024859EC4|nr:CLOCK-interacting pacemaker-like [Salvelinus fontinalis]XP_055791566.1 CLOCK-interacting pacemaker-like [Salvelinus fontinalis]XP_055791567.1 CLOCK-interacting pacemaker-like [Salvelinus fontinalis]